MRFPLRLCAARAVIRCWLWWLDALLRIRLAWYQRDQRVLARRYGIEGCEPELYGDSTHRRILERARMVREPQEFAWTSGTTRDSKQLLYPKRRIRVLQHAYVAQAILAYRHARLGRPAFYFLTSMAPDRSVSGLLAREPLPWWLGRYILCDSIVYEPAVARLIERYPQDVLHLTLLLLNAPVLIAMANPSSLYIIISRAQRDWDSVRTQIRGVLAESGLREFEKQRGSAIYLRETRVRQLLESPTCPPVKALLPELKMVYCWQGGYVQPFLDNLQEQLADLQPIFRPMFSMSTETVAYLIYPRVSTTAGLPIYPGVCYEFIEADDEVSARNLLKPWELHIGQRYLMVVSDAYGLKRYQTNDVFECLGMERHTPLLRFQGRAGLSYSFTGEKITDQQLLDVYAMIRQKTGVIGVFFTCFPKLNKGHVPGYVFVCITEPQATLPSTISTEMFDKALMEVNDEYANKRKSGRLNEPEIVTVNPQQLITRLVNSHARYQYASSAQFKFLPLYDIYWETVK